MIWVLALQPFCFSVEPRPGKLNVTADFLSHSLEREVPLTTSEDLYKKETQQHRLKQGKGRIGKNDYGVGWGVTRH